MTPESSVFLASEPLIWGERDPIFPPERAKQMVPQFANVRFELVPDGALFVHEEQPEAVFNHALPFLES